MPTEAFDPQTGEVIEKKAPPKGGMPQEVAQAVTCVMRDIKRLGKDERNQFSKYDFVSIDKFLETTGPLMAQHGLFIVMDEREWELKRFKSEDKETGWLFMSYDVTLFHQIGVSFGPIRRNVTVPALGAQAFGSAQSYVLKQFLRGLFMIPTGDKDDPDLNAEAQVPSSGAQRPVQQREAQRPPQSPPPPPSPPAPAYKPTEIRPGAVSEPANDAAIEVEKLRSDYRRIKAQLEACRDQVVLDEVLNRESETMSKIFAIPGGSSAKEVLDKIIAGKMDSFGGWAKPSDVPI